MDLTQRITIRTPEGVEMDLVLAGMGSRMLAAVIDLALQAFVLLLFVLAATSWLDSLGSAVANGLTALTMVLILFGYHVVGEVWWNGQTLGKRFMGLRVVTDVGGPVGFVTSLIRTAVRLVDFLPVAYGIGLVSAMASSKSQRLGDMAAGSLVVRTPSKRFAESSATLKLPPPATTAWDVSAVTRDHVAVIRQFAQRRDQLPPETREKLAAKLRLQLRPLVHATTRTKSAEEFVLQVLAEKERAR